jgi:hypothetical protein
MIWFLDLACGAVRWAQHGNENCTSHQVAQRTTRAMSTPPPNDIKPYLHVMSQEDAGLGESREFRKRITHHELL